MAARLVLIRPRMLAVLLLVGVPVFAYAGWKWLKPTANYYMKAAQHAAAHGDEATVLSKLEAALAVDPEHAEALLAKGDALGRAGRMDEALDAWRAVPHSDSAVSLDARCRAADACIGRGWFRTAEEMLQQAMWIHSNAAPAAELLLKLYRVQERSDALRNGLWAGRSARRWTADDLQAFLLCDRPRLTTEYTATLHTALKHDRSDLESAMCLARYERLSGKPERAVEILEGLSAANPARPDVACETALAWLDRRNHDKAVERLAVAGKHPFAPAHGRFWIAAGRCAALRGDPKQAVEAYRFALSLPHLSLALRAECEDLLAAALADSGQKPQAETARGRAAAARQLLDAALALAVGNLEATIVASSAMIERLLAVDAAYEAAAIDHFLTLQNRADAKWKPALTAASRRSQMRMQRMAAGRDAELEAAVARLVNVPAGKKR